MVQLRFAVVFVVLLAGCSSVTTIPPELSLSEKDQLWQQNRARLETIESWALTGRLGLTVPDRSGSMSIEWLQDEQHYSIFLDGPFGQSLAQIKGSRLGVSARVSDEEEVFGATPEYLMRRLTGWDLPVSSLKYWVRGVPAPKGKPEVILNNQGYPKQIIQQGWQIDYLNYRDEGITQMPVRLKAANGDIRMTLVVRFWQLK
ncbi:outer membrane lipoprotein LolB [Endozoicomonas sp. (ex Bugula neritina AB1)]|nr:outer membrane lipoprotein LolB [Endozoicomonas sp. (ex Bugula neritina AB1)]